VPFCARRLCGVATLFWRDVLYWVHERSSAGMARSRARASVAQPQSVSATSERASQNPVGLPVTGDTE
jgi:hypothetical protein